MKKIFVGIILVVFTACNINVDSEKGKDSSKVSITIPNVDTTLNKWSDTAKSRIKTAGKEIKEEWNEHFKKDSTSKKLK